MNSPPKIRSKIKGRLQLEELELKKKKKKKTLDLPFSFEAIIKTYVLV
jgi:hypothetical protein